MRFMVNNISYGIFISLNRKLSSCVRYSINFSYDCITWFSNDFDNSCDNILSQLDIDSKYYEVDQINSIISEQTNDRL